MTTLIVNGQTHELELDADIPLAWVLRERLGLTGTHISCALGICGACTVHVDGAAARSCQMPASALAGHNITTIEGLSSDGSHPVQRAWVSEDVVQCGYCQPGFIMAAAAFLQRHPQPTDADINAELTNVCRCGTYVRVRKAIHLAARLQRVQREQPR